MKVRFSYLKEKFHAEQAEKIWARMKETVTAGDFTLGREVTEFEKIFAELMGAKYAIGVANGTDALILSLWAAGVRAGDEVIAPANTFVATLGAIGLVQATPVLVDVGRNHVIDPDKIAEAITPRTKAILPVHFTGQPCQMDKIMAIANMHGIPVIEDACQSYLASFKGKCAGSFGLTGCFSLHPLKILNVWGDGGVITTNDEKTYRELKLLQNHGMKDRDTYIRFPCYNSRLDSIHAAVANFQIKDTPAHVRQRRANAGHYDYYLRDVVKTSPRIDGEESVYHLYFIEVDPSIRDRLYIYLIESGIECKIHYKTPLYLQEGLLKLGYAKGDFPEADRQCDSIITLPVDELVTRDMQDYVISKIKEFMANV
jgi:aminotransferase EvaB